MQTLIPVSVVWYSSDCLTESAYEHGQYNQCTNWIIQCLAFTAFRYINKSLGLLTNCLNCCSRWVFGTQITNQLTSINRRGFFIFRKNTSRQCVRWSKTKKPTKFHIHCYHSNEFVLALFPSYNPQIEKASHWLYCLTLPWLSFAIHKEFTKLVNLINKSRNLILPPTILSR